MPLTRDQFDTWIRSALDDEDLQPIGGWKERCCYLLARAVLDSLADNGIEGTLVDYTPKGSSVAMHIAVAVGSLRLDRDGVWTDGDCPDSLKDCAQTFFDRRTAQEKRRKAR